MTLVAMATRRSFLILALFACLASAQRQRQRPEQMPPQREGRSQVDWYLFDVDAVTNAPVGKMVPVPMVAYQRGNRQHSSFLEGMKLKHSQGVSMGNTGGMNYCYHRTLETMGVCKMYSECVYAQQHPQQHWSGRTEMCDATHLCCPYSDDGIVYPTWDPYSLEYFPPPNCYNPQHNHNYAPPPLPLLPPQGPHNQHVQPTGPQQPELPPRVDSDLYFPNQPPMHPEHNKPMQPTFGSKPMQPTFGSKPMPPTFGSKPMQPTFGSKPMQPTFGSKPMQPTFAGSKPMQPTFGSRPMQPTFGSKPMQPTFGSNPMQPSMSPKPKPPRPTTTPPSTTTLDPTIPLDLEVPLDSELVTLINLEAEAILDPVNKRKNNRMPGDIARRKCIEYEKYAPKVRYGPAKDCVKNHTYPIGGNPAAPREFPQFAQLGIGRRNSIDWFCGGALIAPTWVLTAAHCVFNGDRQVQWVRLGDIEPHSDTDDSNPQIIAVSQAIRHPDYKVLEVYNDIALLRLTREPDMTTPHVRPACLQIDKNLRKDKLNLIGFGLTEENGEPAAELMEVALYRTPFEKCNGFFSGEVNLRQLPQGLLDESQLCAGLDQVGKDACQGDSGGPLNTPFSLSCMHNIAGVTSFGQGCGRGAPGVYTRVSYFVPWIESIVWADEA